MSKALVLNLYAGPGSLKSTTAAGVFTLLKLHGVECDAPHEFPKDLVWEENLSMMDDQNYVLGNQAHRIWRVKDKVDVIIVDSPILFSIVYRKDDLGQEFIDHVVALHKSYNNINIFIERDTTKGFVDNGRDHDFKTSLAIDKRVLEILNKYSTSYTIMKANYSIINKLTTLVLDKLDIKLKYKLEEANE